MGFLRLISIFLIALNLYADIVTELKIEIIKDISNLYCKKTPVKIYINSSYFNNIKNLPYPFILSKNISKSNVCFVDTYNKKCKITFVTSYISYIKNKSKIAGAFFYQKGRPVIILNKKYIIKHHIKLPKEYKEFVE